MIERGFQSSLYHVVATAQNGVIGKDNKLPWHFSADLKFFKALTTGHTVIMGRKTFDSIGRPLPNRQNFILSRSSYKVIVESFSKLKPEEQNIANFDSIETALQAVQTEKAFIIGGAEIYKQTIDKIDGIYQTLIHQDFEGDAFYPGIPANFKEISREKLQESPLIEVIVYQRKSS